MITAMRILRDSGSKLMRVDAFKMAAALSYYAGLSLAPLLMILLAVVGLIVERAVVVGSISREVERVLGSGAGELVRAMLVADRTDAGGVVAMVLGSVTLLFGATGVFVELQDDLNILWGTKVRDRGGALSFLRHRLLSLAMVMSIGFLLLISFFVNGVVSLVAGALGNISSGQAVLAVVLHAAAALLCDMLFFALIFKFLPDTKVAWRAVWRGAFATSALFVLGQFAIGQYIGRAAVGSMYGTAGSLVVILVWVYYSSLLVLFGAALTERLASRVDRP
jgi:membrane protein